jgi:hypothetical protein
MIAAKRTSRDATAIILPVLLILTASMTYVSLESIGLVPVVGTISADAIWVMAITVLLWFVLLKYVYGLIHPVIYLTEIFPERIIFSDSSNPANPIIIARDDVVKFYVEPTRWWHSADGSDCYRILCETRTGKTMKLGWNFILSNNSQGFFDAVREVWGNEYAPTT